MKKTVVHIPKMDCPSEIKMIESSLDSLIESNKMNFSLSDRSATFYHEKDIEDILERLEKIGLPGKLSSSQDISKDEVPSLGPSVESKTLRYLLAINLTMFFVEIIFGFISNSTGLLADGLDMLADAFVYGVSLFAVGKSLKRKQRAAHFSGIAQVGLGLLCLSEVTRRFVYGSEPLSSYMIAISLIALTANVFCLFLIYKHKEGEVHMKASWIFSANDVLVNLGVIVSGVLVYFFNSNYPDLIIGGFVSLVVIKSGLKIIKMSKNSS